MRLPAVRSLAALFVGALLAAAPCVATESDEAARQLVKRLRLGASLPVVGLRAAANTPTYRTLAESVGAEKARALVKEELDKARPRYQEQWDRDLAAAYAPLFTAEELRSLAEKQKQSPHIQKFLSKQAEIGKSMQAKSIGLITNYVTDALMSAMQQAAPGKRP